MQRAQLLAEAQRILHNKTYTREDTARIEGLLALADRLTPEETKQELRKAQVANMDRELHPVPESQWEARWYSWLRDPSKEGYGEVQRAYLEDRTVSYSPQTVTTTEGGHLVPKGFTNAVLEVMRQTGAFYNATTLVPTPRGNAFSHPSLDDNSEGEAVEGAAVAINTEGTAAAIAFGSIAWGVPPKYSSKWVLVPIELAQDSLYDLPPLLAGVLGRRLVRAIERAFITTLLSSATSAFTAASTTAVTADECLDLLTAPDSVYAQRGSWIMNFQSYCAISQLKSGGATGDYIFPMQNDASGRPIIAGQPVLIVPVMPDLEAGAKAIAYGDVSQFYRREVTDSWRLVALREQYMESGQYAFQAQVRMDGKLLVSIDPSGSNSPIQYITMHA